MADASPLIALARIGQLILLRELFGTVVIPVAVDEEITRHPRGFEGIRPDWIVVHRAADTSAVAALRSVLDRGEAEALVLARQLGTPILIDELAGRRVAASLDLKVTGTLGSLLTAKRRGLIDSLDGMLTLLQSANFRMSPQLLAELRQAAGEG